MVTDTAAGYITADVEGLTLYKTAENSGYLIASIQGDNLFAVFEREGKNKYIGCFRIGESDQTDAVSETDGIDVVNLGLNNQFPNGFFIAQDGHNKTKSGDDTTQNFKLVPWEEIANNFEVPLIIDNKFDSSK